MWVGGVLVYASHFVVGAGLKRLIEGIFGGRNVMIRELKFAGYCKTGNLLTI